MDSINAHIHYAINHEGKLVHIDSVPNGNACGCICPACKMPLQARNAGQIREHHFAHQSGVDCPHAYESILHLLAKEKIQKAFYEHDVFNIEFEYHSFCINKKNCKYVRYGDCSMKERKIFNLKEYYDSCEQEIPYDKNRRRSDLKIWSKTHPEHNPVYIEFFVTHKSKEEKLHSGSRIIEIKIDSEDDIDKVIDNGFSEEQHNSYSQAGDTVMTKTSFYGFKNEDYSNQNINQEIHFSRYILYLSGKSQCYQDDCKCNELKRIAPNALCEICFHKDISFGIYEIAKWIGYNKFHIKNCLLCENYVDNYYEPGKFCKLYKYLGLNRDQQHDTARAKTCKSFILNEQEMNKCANDEKPPITEL